MTGLARAIAAARERAERGDRGSLVLALLVAVVGSGIAALLVPLVVAQMSTTRFDDSRARELNAAEAGTEVALGLLRSASDSSGVGVVDSLPCSGAGGFGGSVAGSSTGLSYVVRLGYYTENPLGQSDDWLATYTAGGVGHAMLCAPGKGTYYPPSQEVVPSFVLITATGSDARGSRTLRSTYIVRTTNANVAGGTIYVFPSGSGNYCMDAGSAHPIAGATVRVQPCAQPVAQQQAWAYNTDLAIQLVSSVTAAYPNGLCLSALDSDGEEAAGNLVQLQPCAELGKAPWSQMWSVDNAAHLRGSKPDESDVNSLCVNAPSQGAGVALTLAGCAGGVTDTKQTWVPSPDVGAGGAGAANDQIVNFQQFGRCMDVTDTNVDKGFLIAYTCKQNPNPSKVLWNQKFTYDSSTHEWVTNNGSPYCLTSPLQVYGRGASGPWVTLQPCPATPTDAVSWTRYGATDSDGNPRPRDEKYTVRDADGNCLSLTSDTAVAYNGQYSKVIVAPCDGTTLQKWNADPDLQSPSLENVMEIANP